MPMSEQRARELRYVATVASVSIGAIALTTEHEGVAWFGVLCAAGVWAVAMLATWRTD